MAPKKQPKKPAKVSNAVTSIVTSEVASSNADSSTKKYYGPELVLQFWGELQKSELLMSQLLCIPLDEIFGQVTQSADRELLRVGFDAMQRETGKVDWIVGKFDIRFENAIKNQNPSIPIMFLSKLPDGVFVSGATCRAINRLIADFVVFNPSAGVFNVLMNESLQNLIKSMRGPHDVPPPIRYTEDKYTLHFINLLTYPRPVRKFNMLLGKSTLVAFLREMMMSEVGFTDVTKLVLLVRGKELPRSYDLRSLEGAGIRNNQKIIVSVKLGPDVNQDAAAVRERNKRFVGDILFRTGSDITKTPESPKNSILTTFRVSHGYQIIGQSIERILLMGISDAFRREETAKASEKELYALLEEETREQLADHEKRQKKKSKQKKASTSATLLASAPTPWSASESSSELNPTNSTDSSGPMNPAEKTDIAGIDSVTYSTPFASRRDLDHDLQTVTSFISSKLKINEETAAAAIEAIISGTEGGFRHESQSLQMTVDSPLGAVAVDSPLGADSAFEPQAEVATVGKKSKQQKRADKLAKLKADRAGGNTVLAAASAAAKAGGGATPIATVMPPLADAAAAAQSHLPQEGGHLNSSKPAQDPLTAMKGPQILPSAQSATVDQCAADRAIPAVTSPHMAAGSTDAVIQRHVQPQSNVKQVERLPDGIVASMRELELTMGSSITAFLPSIAAYLPLDPDPAVVQPGTRIVQPASVNGFYEGREPERMDHSSLTGAAAAASIPHNQASIPKVDSSSAALSSQCNRPNEPSSLSQLSQSPLTRAETTTSVVYPPAIFQAPKTGAASTTQLQTDFSPMSPSAAPKDPSHAFALPQLPFSSPKFCPSCGNKLLKSYRFCSNCGLSVESMLLDNDSIGEPSIQEPAKHSPPSAVGSLPLTEVPSPPPLPLPLVAPATLVNGFGERPTFPSCTIEQTRSPQETLLSLSHAMRLSGSSPESTHTQPLNPFQPMNLLHADTMQSTRPLHPVNSSEAPADETVVPMFPTQGAALHPYGLAAQPVMRSAPYASGTQADAMQSENPYYPLPPSPIARGSSAPADLSAASYPFPHHLLGGAAASSRSQMDMAAWMAISSAHSHVASGSSAQPYHYHSGPNPRSPNTSRFFGDDGLVLPSPKSSPQDGLKVASTLGASPQDLNGLGGAPTDMHLYNLGQPPLRGGYHGGGVAADRSIAHNIDSQQWGVGGGGVDATLQDWLRFRGPPEIQQQQQQLHQQQQQHQWAGASINGAAQEAAGVAFTAAYGAVGPPHLQRASSEGDIARLRSHAMPITASTANPGAYSSHTNLHSPYSHAPAPHAHSQWNTQQGFSPNRRGIEDILSFDAVLDPCNRPNGASLVPVLGAGIEGGIGGDGWGHLNTSAPDFSAAALQTSLYAGFRSGGGGGGGGGGSPVGVGVVGGGGGRGGGECERRDEAGWQVSHAAPETERPALSLSSPRYGNDFPYLGAPLGPAHESEPARPGSPRGMGRLPVFQGLPDGITNRP